MRVIKFRAWHKMREEMFQVSWISWGEHTLGDGAGMTLRFSDVEALMQFTGVRDKNGKECFEGDIVKRYEHNDIVEIVYRDDWGAFAFKGKTNISTGWSHLHSGHNGSAAWEIIGTVYENPDLLT